MLSYVIIGATVLTLWSSNQDKAHSCLCHSTDWLSNILPHYLDFEYHVETFHYNFAEYKLKANN